MYVCLKHSNFGQFWLLGQFLTNSDYWELWTIFERFYNFTILTILTIFETCDIWDTEYNADNWKSEFMKSLLPDN